MNMVGEGVREAVCVPVIVCEMVLVRVAVADRVRVSVLLAVAAAETLALALAVRVAVPVVVALGDGGLDRDDDRVPVSLGDAVTAAVAEFEGVAGVELPGAVAACTMA